MRKMLMMTAMLLIAATFCCTSCTAQSEANAKVLSVLEFRNKLSAEANIQLVDVRTPEEFAAGHIEGAENINVSAEDFETQIQKLDKNRPVMIYCRSGKRSAKAGALMQQLGFKEIYDLDGGYLRWTAER